MIKRYLHKMTWKPRYFDIGVNFSDNMFQGCYNGSKNAKHPPDIDRVISRAQTFNVNKMLITASSIQESEDHFSLVKQYKQYFGSTVGVHPCTVAQEFYVKNEDGEYTEQLDASVDGKLEKIKKLTVDGFELGIVKAFGEIGLDYDRLHYSSKQQQLTMFEKQLEVVSSLKHYEIPLFLHMRSACDDFVSVIKPFIERGDIKRGNGVVHSFTGTNEELQKLLDLGFYIGINGCSLRNQENLDVAKNVPQDRLMIETDAPWCEIRRSHASHSLLSAYPNKFYPEIRTEQQEEKQTDQKEPKKTQQKLPQIKMDDFLPFPSIKKEHFLKHQEAAKTLKLHRELPESHETEIGEFAYPLIKSRNEPVFVGLVAEIMAGLYGLKDDKEIEEFIDLVYTNSCSLFRL